MLIGAGSRRYKQLFLIEVPKILCTSVLSPVVTTVELFLMWKLFPSSSHPCYCLLNFFPVLLYFIWDESRRNQTCIEYWKCLHSLDLQREIMAVFFVTCFPANPQTSFCLIVLTVIEHWAMIFTHYNFKTCFS